MRRTKRKKTLVELSDHGGLVNRKINDKIGKKVSFIVEVYFQVF